MHTPTLTPGTAAALAAGLLAAPALHAQGVLALTTNLPPIVVQASRTGQTAEEMSTGVTLITSDQIRRSGVADTVQALERLGGLYFRRLSGNPSEAEVVMRGFGQLAHGRVLVLVDGQRLNEPDQAAPNWSRIPVQAIERIEVLHGGQTALYGNHAVAGVINIITRHGSEPLTTVSATAGSEDTFGTHVHRSGGLGEDTRYAADVDWQKSQGWRANSEYETYDARARVEHDWTERFSSSVGSFYNRNAFGMPGPLTRSEARADPRQSTHPDDNARHEAWGVDLGSRAETVDWGEFSLQLLGQRRLRSTETVSWFENSHHQSDSLALSPKYTLDKELGGHRNLLTLGSDWNVDRLDFAKTPIPAAPLTSDVRLDRVSGALFARDEFFLNDKLSLALGARREAMRTSINGFSGAAGLDEASTDWKSAFDASLLYRPSEGQKYFARASTLYRFPFLDEVASYQGFGGGFNPSLAPEEGRQLEAGLSLELPSHLTYDLRVYRLDMRDEIAWSGTTWRNENLDETRRNGLETGLRWTPSDRGSLGVSYQLIDAEFSDGASKGNSIPLVPENVLTLDGELKVAYGVSLLAAMRAVSPQFVGDDTDNSNSRIPGYVVFDTGVRYVPAFCKEFSLLFACDNVFDKRYATSGFEWLDSVYPANGRMWRFTGSYTF